MARGLEDTFPDSDDEPAEKDRFYDKRVMFLNDLTKMSVSSDPFGKNFKFPNVL